MHLPLPPLARLPAPPLSPLQLQLLALQQQQQQRLLQRRGQQGLWQLVRLARGLLLLLGGAW